MKILEKKHKEPGKLLICFLIWGVWCLNVDATPLLSFELKKDAEYRFEQIEQLQTNTWTHSKEDQDVLWTWFWESRLGLKYDDPDIFERILNIQIGLANEHPKEIIDHLKESTILSEMAWTILEKDYKLSSQLLDASAHQRIHTRLGDMIEQSVDSDPSEWLQCWKSAGGSVGVELFRYTLETIHTELTAAVALPHASKEMYDGWGLQSKPAPACPLYQPGQSYQQPIPQEPELYMSMGTIGKPPFNPDFNPRIIINGFIAIIGLGWLYQRNRKIFFSIVTPILFIGGIEALIAPLVNPLIETTPMFQVQNWSVVPWIETDTQYLTQGDYLRAQRIDKNKNKKRLVVLGASSAHGSNELMEDTFSGIVDENLEWDVINLAIGGTTSAGLVTLTPYVEQLNPDALVIYYGHNEVHQLRKLNQFQTTSLKAMKFQRLLWSSRLYTTLHNILPDKTHHSEIDNTQTNSDAPSSISEEEFIELAEYHFFHNMSFILSKLDRVPILLISPPTNYPFAPMADTEVYTDYIEDIQRRIDTYPEATTIHSSIRKQILRLAATYQTTHWDLDFHFHRHSPDVLSANGLFWDELHPSALGHQWIARGVQKWLHEVEVESHHVDAQ